MADVNKRNAVSGCSRRQSSRLQRRAPASIQINRCPEWNVAIPLLSPLVSPSSPDQIGKSTVEKIAAEESKSQDLRHLRRPGSEPEKPTIFKKWQHPAAPFCYEPNPRIPPFVPV